MATKSIPQKYSKADVKLSYYNGSYQLARPSFFAPGQGCCSSLACLLIDHHFIVPQHGTPCREILQQHTRPLADA